VISKVNVVISQPRYIPAVSYLQRIYFSDIFVVLDTVQRQARGFENRNKLLLPNPAWLTVPIGSSSRALIKDSLIKECDWASDHKKKVAENYKLSPYFDIELLDKWYDGLEEFQNFSDAMEKMLKNICESLSFSLNLVRASSIESHDCPPSGPDKLRWLTQAVGANVYISGVNGMTYGVKEAFSETDVTALFHKNEITLYSQSRADEFVPYLGFIDMVFNCGLDFLKSEISRPPVYVTG
jgi:hypothetical protein